ncbi:MAG: hypothetical protein ACI8RZ_004208 [Myxococcota bacterium]|jgi:hypothetical protein
MKKPTLILGAALVAFSLACSGTDDAEMITIEAPVEPAVEEPAVEEPAVEEPAVEELAVEEPAVEEPARERKVPKGTKTKARGPR